MHKRLKFGKRHLTLRIREAIYWTSLWFDYVCMLRFLRLIFHRLSPVAILFSERRHR